MFTGRILRAILMIFLSLFYGWLVLLFLSYKLIRNGRKFFEIKRVTEAPKAAFDPKYGTHSFVTLKNQGIRLHYVESGNRSNPMVLMIHGFPDFWYSWRHQIPKLSEKFWVVAVDLRGYGDSDQPRHVKDYKMSNLTADMKELILSLGKDSAIVMGHDWGGIISWYLATEEPELVKKLIILNAPPPPVFQKFFWRSWRQFFMSWYMLAFQLPYLPELFFTSNNLEAFRRIFQNKEKEFITNEEYELYHFTFSQPGAFTPPLNYYRAAFRTSKRSKANSSIRCPTLIIWGDEDKALCSALPDLAKDYCDKVDVVKISAGHWVHHERPDLVNKHILDFTRN